MNRPRQVLYIQRTDCEREMGAQATYGFWILVGSNHVVVGNPRVIMFCKNILLRGRVTKFCCAVAQRNNSYCNKSRIKMLWNIHQNNVHVSVLINALKYQYFCHCQSKTKPCKNGLNLIPFGDDFCFKRIGAQTGEIVSTSCSVEFQAQKLLLKGIKLYFLTWI